MVYVHIVDTISSIYFYIYVFYPFNIVFLQFCQFSQKIYEIYLFTSKYCLNCIVTRN